MVNANTWGISDLFRGLFSHDPLDDFDTDEEKAEYLNGRLQGDMLATFQGELEQTIGRSVAGIGAAGGPVGAAVSLAGVSVAVHGMGTTYAATGDAAVSTAKLLIIESRMKSRMIETRKKYDKFNKSTLDKGSSDWVHDHHVSTDKHTSYWTDQFKKLFDRAGLNISKAKENIVKVINHQGPHPDEYHKYIYNRLVKATSKAKNDEEFRALFIKELKRLGKECQRVGSRLNKMITSASKQ